MKKHVDVNRSSSMKKLVEEHSMKAPPDQKVNEKEVSCFFIYNF
jgi:hypothetical protein